MTDQPSYGEVEGPRAGEISRRRFMRRMLGIGVGILSLEFIGGTLAFLWPNITEGLGAVFELGTAADIAAEEPEWPQGRAYSFQQANVFFLNVPAAMALVEGTGESVPDPGEDVLALWRTCPHLGCQIPPLCEASKWHECLCHGSQYTILGEKRGGPAPRGMDSFPVRLEGAVYLLDTSEVIAGPPPGTVTFDPRTPDQMPHCSA
jgi:cytochrome b6-f complex iron-sulfur subunit